MLNLLQSQADKLSLVTSAAAAVDVFAAFADTDPTMTTSSNVVSGLTPTLITTATTTDVVATPGASLVRNVKFLSIRNHDAALSCDVTLQLNRSATLYQLHKVTLLVGESLVCNEGTFFHYDANGGVYGAVAGGHELNNFSTGAQTPTAATLTQIVGTSIAIPTTKLKIGTRIRWTFNLTKTGAGTALSTIAIRIGTANSTADAAICSFTKPAGTAVIDEGKIVIEVVIRGPLTAACIAAGHMTMTHNLAATGHMVIPIADVDVVSSGFDATVSGLFASLSITSGASDAITIQDVFSESWNLAA